MVSAVGVVAAIDNSVLAVEPGVEVSRDIRVRNTGMVVDRIALEVLGELEPWTEIEPAQLNLLPGTDATVRLIFQVPRSPVVLAGEVDFAVRASSQEDPDGSVIEEGTITVLPFDELSAELEPKTVRARRVSRFRLVVSNLGNHPVTTEISALDEDDLLDFRTRPAAVVAHPGTSTYVRLRAAPRKRFVKGPDKALPFQAFVLPEAADPVTVDGAVLQRQMMPKWLLPAIALVTVVVVALLALWFLVLKPTVQSTAAAVVAAQSQQLAAGASAASQAAVQANQAAANANTAAGSGAGGGAGGSKPGAANGSGAGAGTGAGTPGASTAPTTPDAGSAAAGTPVSADLQSNAAPTTSASFTTYPYAFAAGQKTLQVSDLVLQNPMGDSGILQIRAGGQPLLVFGLDDFRSQDLHFVQPLVFTATAPLTLAVECLNAGATHCSAAVSFSGTTGK
jgi:hypothetical protein